VISGWWNVSALQLLGTPPPGDSKSFKDDWLEFERNTAHWLQSQGWEIEQWGASRRGDRGVDIVASKQGRLALVQCKYWDIFKTFDLSLVDCPGPQEL
jgi:hypothetical protein